jgi:hypothetical protein
VSEERHSEMANTCREKPYRQTRAAQSEPQCGYRHNRFHSPALPERENGAYSVIMTTPRFRPIRCSYLLEAREVSRAESMGSYLQLAPSFWGSLDCLATGLRDL